MEWTKILGSDHRSLTGAARASNPETNDFSLWNCRGFVNPRHSRVCDDFVAGITRLLCLVEPMVADTIQLLWSSLNMEFISTIFRCFAHYVDFAPPLEDARILLGEEQIAFADIPGYDFFLYGSVFPDAEKSLTFGTRVIDHPALSGLQCHPKRRLVEVLLFTLQIDFRAGEARSLLPIDTHGAFFTGLAWDRGYVQSKLDRSASLLFRGSIPFLVAL
ncbi:hypothetical protein FNV43_RR08166 [Rhamnella rubrinervis]|uniref:Uncharacterized protein n=1 Tax=Rhamnella rubrinervis TaxID=2594499 RepID=A0A8K0HHZ1_9ROSA|nr:hypothetical protein FNV43_RR08166 [Rhamnella rubrinervis]